ncbi:TIGR04255 family protein [Aerosticca soli]|uniref:TIGR04255 family protein n=1 Tax=Aerosticca soli TaxID=2010829 RepID=UPI000F846DC1|nr:TIGR04255 family protein [Aerosticca soli]MDI3258948.1 TIGR04255 family protein [Nevskiaceae bacterium]
MTDAWPKLAKPPIVEAVLDFDCDVPPDKTLKLLEQPAREAFADRYSDVVPRYLQEMQVGSDQDGMLNSSLRQSLEAWMFRQADGKQLVQIRQAGFSFNRLAPYDGFETYLPEIERVWNLYRELAAPISVRTLRLRYINRILLPLVGGRVDLHVYLGSQPTLPDEARLTLSGFINQYFAVDAVTGHQVAVTFAAQPPEDDKLPVIFDNAVSASGEWEPADWSAMYSVLESLRDLKNMIFFKTVKQPCLDLFQ